MKRIMGSPTVTTFASHVQLVAWLRDEIGRVPVSTLLKHSPPPMLGDLASMSEEQANAQVLRTFIDSFMPEADHARQQNFLTQTMPRATRLKIGAPLPLTDFMVMLARPASGTDPLVRAASLCHAAAALHLQFEAGDLSTDLSRCTSKANCSIYDNAFGISIVPGIAEHDVCISKGSTYCLVLVEGNAYVVDVIDHGMPVSVERIRAAFERITREPANPGVVGLLRSVPLDLAAELATALHPDVLEALYSALFVVCLDGRATAANTATSLDEVAVALFRGDRVNRWYGTTQIVVRPDAEAALIFSYMAGMDGVQGNEIADQLHKNASAVEWGSAATVDCARSRGPLELGISDAIAARLQASSTACFHDCQAVFVLPFGLRAFKALEVSPNVAIQALLMLAFRDVGELPYLPETSQAVLVRPDDWGGVQLDWLRARPEGLRRFSEHPCDLSLFRAAVEAQKDLVWRARDTLSPFLYFDQPGQPDQPDQPERDRLVEFYLALGHEEQVGAYRHYLCPATRDPRALDLITSSIILWDSIELLGRPGARSLLVGMSGSHVLFDDDQTRLSFIPNVQWEARLPHVTERVIHWMQHLQSLQTATKLDNASGHVR